MNAPPRILFVNHVSRVSGAERSLLDLIGQLDRARFEPLAALPPGGELPEALARLGVPCHPLPLRRLRKTANPFRLAATFLHVARVRARLADLLRRERVALVHANSNTAQLYAGAAARRGGVPCVWHTRDLVRLGPLGRRLDRLSERTIAISECVRRHVGAYTRDVSKIATVYSGIDPAAFAASGGRARLRAELGLPADAPVVGMVGQLVPWKRHDAFIETAARVAAAVPAARFVIAGADLFGEHAPWRAALTRRARAPRIADRVLFAGFRADMAAFLDGLDVLVHPAVREPLGRAILEAMAAGKPVVAVNACGPAEIVRDGVDGLLTRTGRAAELAEAVLRLLGDRALADRLGAAARQRVRDTFDVRRTTRQIEAIYDSLLTSPQP